MTGYVHPHSYIQLKKLRIFHTHTHTQSMWRLDNTYGDECIFHI